MIKQKLDELIALATVEEPELAVILNLYMGAKLMHQQRIFCKAVVKFVEETLIPMAQQLQQEDKAKMN